MNDLASLQVFTAEQKLPNGWSGKAERLSVGKHPPAPNVSPQSSQVEDVGPPRSRVYVVITSRVKKHVHFYNYQARVFRKSQKSLSPILNDAPSTANNPLHDGLGRINMCISDVGVCAMPRLFPSQHSAASQRPTSILT